MAHRLDVHHLDVVAGGEVLDIGYAVDDRQTTLIDAFKRIGLRDLGS